VKDTQKYLTLTMAHRCVGGRVSVETLRKRADTGKIRSVRDPIGRRLLRREDVELLAERLGVAPLSSARDVNGSSR